MNITTVYFAAGSRYATAKTNLWQWDYGQILQIQGLDLPEAYAVHFSNEPAQGTSSTEIGGPGGVQIPDAYLQTGKPVYAFIFLHTGEDDGETEYKITIYVNARPQPGGETPTPEQQSVIDQLIAAMDKAVEDAEVAQNKAEEAEREANDAERGAWEFSKDAEAWATGQRGGADVPSTDPTFENNAKYYAGLAEQSAAQAGYMFFYIDADGHLIYQHTTNTEVDFYLEDGHLFVEATA